MAVSDNPRERLLDTAGEIFAEKGLAGATVREIIKKAGLNIAAVNYYFRDKERLYIETVKHAACSGPDLGPTWPDGTPAVVRLREFIHFQLSKFLDPDKPAWHARLVMRELTQPSEACAELVRDYIEPKSRILQGILSELLPADTPRWKAFMTAFSIVGQCHFYCSHKPIVMLLVGKGEYKRFDTDALADHITEFTLRALNAEEDISPRKARKTRKKDKYQKGDRERV